MFRQRISLLIVFTLPTIFLAAQPNRFGQPYIQNYHYTETGGSEQNWGIARDLRGMIYVANNDNGILEYDGSSWRSCAVPESVSARSVAAGEDGFIYAGLDGDVGRLEPDQKGSLHFRSLLDSVQRESYAAVSFWRTYIRENRVYFCGLQAILVFDPDHDSVSVIDTPEHAFLSFFPGNDLYISDFGSGLMKYTTDEFVPVRGGEHFMEKNISGLLAVDSGRLLVSTFYSGLYLLDPLNGTIDSTFILPSLLDELIAAGILHMQGTGEDLYIGTREAGLFVLDKNWELKERLSENEGLLDNFVPYFIIDQDQGGAQALWLVHMKGISRVDISSPFRSLSIGQGSRGMYGRSGNDVITDLDEFSGNIFVSTAGGLLQHPVSRRDMRFRPLREIREEIHDLQLSEPIPGTAFLLAAGNEKTFVLDRELQVSTLPAGGRKLLVDRNNPRLFYTGDDHFMAFLHTHGRWIEVLDLDLGRRILNMCQDQHGLIWIPTRGALLRLEPEEGKEPVLKNFDQSSGLPPGELDVFTDPDSQELLVGSTEGIFRFDYTKENFLFDSLYNNLLPGTTNKMKAIHKGASNRYWFSYQNDNSGWDMLAAVRTDSGFQRIYNRLFRELSTRVSTDVFFTDSDQKLWFSKANELFLFDESRAREARDSFEVLMRKVSINGDSVLFDGTYFREHATGQRQPVPQQGPETQPRLNHQYRNMEFQWSAPYFKNERQIRFSHHLKGFGQDWSEWSRERTAKFTNLPFGKYEMQVKARNVFGDESQVTTYAFSILRPWYANLTAIVIYFVLLASLVVFVLSYTRKLRSRALLLEKQNREIELQKKELEVLNEEITAQRDEIESQRDSISEQKELIDRQNMALTDSIVYAKRIQDAVLPAKEVMRYLLPKHFVFYRPRDIVSGDFFWVDKRDDTVLVAVADCTGHGVPGAFMSMLGISLLNEISSKFTDHPTNEIMDELRDRVIAALGQTGDRYETRDGIEMSLLAINTKTREVQFTGANHKLYTFQKGESVIISGDSMPVGIHSESSTLFSAKNIRLNRGDTLYMFSDGFIDQFGGNKRKKYGTQRLKTLLAQLQMSIMLDQHAAVEKAYEDWKGSNEQIDDVLMVGIKL